MSDDDPREREVYATGVEGREYRSSSYMPTAYDNLDIAPDSEGYPQRGRDGEFRLLDLPRVPKLSHVVGPSAIMLGASLGSGETLFWPVLIAQHGWALYWAFFFGVITQFFMNTEIQRWTLATGESIFRAFERVHRFWPLFFLLLGFVSLGWPGWAASAAKVGAIGLGSEELTLSVGAVDLAAWRLFGIVLMVLIWLTYQLTPLMYNVVERIQIVLVSIASLFAVALFVALGSVNELANVPGGIASVGTIPPGSDIAVFLGGLAYAGAGGYLNLSQSLWVREKGYAMGRYQGRIKNPVVGDDPEPVQRDGFTFPPTVTNLRRWRGWWRLAQLEHLLTFVVGLLVVATMMMALASEYAHGTSDDGVVMWAEVIVPQVGPIGGGLIFTTLFFALLTTEYAIVESFVRNSADIVYEVYGRAAGWSLPRIFWILLTVFILWGIAILGSPIPIEQPFGLLVVAAAMSGVMMWPYTALLLVVNTTRLPEHTQPGWFRVATLWWATGFFGYFSVLLIGNTLTQLGAPVFDTAANVVDSGVGGYALFGVFVLVQIVVVVASIRGKRTTDRTVDAADEAAWYFP
ncbi:Nramp family divalent metal transporter [Haloarcula pelagica]|uniref:Nramp family divalent metal transporter n=1 Tax=Haloarcula pelagica TaxID=3033389 RepID=UPI0024C2C244|nr:Nramp family divalent metal transporter [Halomicroarcula sp. YJ-61-S]